MELNSRSTCRAVPHQSSDCRSVGLIPSGSSVARISCGRIFSYRGVLSTIYKEFDCLFGNLISDNMKSRARGGAIAPSAPALPTGSRCRPLAPSNTRFSRVSLPLFFFGGGGGPGSSALHRFCHLSRSSTIHTTSRTQKRTHRKIG